MTNDLITFDLLCTCKSALVNILDLSALDTGNVMMVAVPCRAQAIMFFSVELLDARQDAAIGEALEIAINARKPAFIKLLLKPNPYFFRRQMRLAIREQGNDRLSARR